MCFWSWDRGSVGWRRGCHERGVDSHSTKSRASPKPGVAGHAGRLVCGRVEGKRVLFQAGRFHFYEGHASGVVVAPVRLAAHLGARTVDPHQRCRGHCAGAGSRVPPPPGRPHQPHGTKSSCGTGGGWRGEVPGHECSVRQRASGPGSGGGSENGGFPFREGTYAAVLGPSYETPAEIRFLRVAGADAVGMSTVPEAITARALGMRVLAFSLITNQAAGLGSGLLNHDEVLEVGRRGRGAAQGADSRNPGPDGNLGQAVRHPCAPRPSYKRPGREEKAVPAK